MCGVVTQLLCFILMQHPHLTCGFFPPGGPQLCFMGFVHKLLVLNKRKPNKNLTYFSNLSFKIKVSLKSKTISKRFLGMKEFHFSVVSSQTGATTLASLISGVEAPLSSNFLPCFIQVNACLVWQQAEHLPFGRIIPKNYIEIWGGQRGHCL